MSVIIYNILLGNIAKSEEIEVNISQNQQTSNGKNL